MLMPDRFYPTGADVFYSSLFLRLSRLSLEYDSEDDSLDFYRCSPSCFVMGSYLIIDGLSVLTVFSLSCLLYFSAYRPYFLYFLQPYVLESSNDLSRLTLQNPFCGPTPASRFSNQSISSAMNLGFCNSTMLSLTMLTTWPSSSWSAGCFLRCPCIRLLLKCRPGCGRGSATGLVLLPSDLIIISDILIYGKQDHLCGMCALQLPLSAYTSNLTISTGSRISISMEQGITQAGSSHSIKLLPSQTLAFLMKVDSRLYLLTRLDSIAQIPYRQTHLCSGCWPGRSKMRNAGFMGSSEIIVMYFPPDFHGTLFPCSQILCTPSYLFYCFPNGFQKPRLINPKSDLMLGDVNLGCSIAKRGLT